jgi:proline iminopeptidase
MDEGYIPVRGGWVWYRRVGPPDTVPLLVLHGGPAAGFDYLRSLEALADERMVVFYDQSGCGRSDADLDPRRINIDYFVAEVHAVRRALHLDRTHLLGHSWGGWLAIEYMLTKPAGVHSLTLASTSASLPEYVREIERLRGALPPEIVATLRQHETSGTLNHPDYKTALLSFYQHHLCRLEVWPPELINTMRSMADNVVYTSLQGPNEFIVNGKLKDWDRTDRLAELDVPTQVTVGRYDEITPACAATLQGGIPGAQLHVFEQSAHMPHMEEPEAYLRVLRQFLHQADAAV